MRCQKEKFILTGKKTYLNCAYMSPMLKKVEKAGIKGLKRKRKPYNLLPEHFFDEVETLQKNFSNLINCKEHKRIAITPSVSYGLGNITNNINISKGENVVLIQDQFPSNVYPWLSLTKRNNAEIIFVERPKGVDNIGENWNKKIIKSISNKTKVVSIGTIHWADGTIYDLQKIRERTNEVGAKFILDGTQSIGALPFDVNKIKPDALICAGYKWLMGPYGISLAYYSSAFDDGIPIEESWVNRKDSKVFSQLVNYKDSYGDLAKRYNVGQQSNFINIPMLNQGIKQLHAWGVNNIQEYCKNITKEGLKTIDKNKIWYEEDDYRAWHLFGLFPKKNLKKILKKIREKNIHISLRGETIRVSPNVYNNKRDLDKFFNTISKNI